MKFIPALPRTVPLLNGPSSKPHILEANCGEGSAYMGLVRSGISDHWLERNQFLHESISGYQMSGNDGG